MRRTIFINLLFIAITSSTYGQDSLPVFTLLNMMELVNENHPIIRQSRLQSEFALAEITKAKGSLDPKLTSSYSTKDFKGISYYDKFNGTLKIPTWFPVDPKIEINKNNGQYLNSENYISSSSDYWQISTGLSLPIGKGLFIDERRSMIKQARMLESLAEAEQTKLINTALLYIIEDYWDWYNAHKQYELMSQSIVIAKNLFERIKIDYQFGEASVIDTIQSLITLQNRKIDFENASLSLRQARFTLNIHLWGPDGIPLELDENAIPSDQETIGIVPEDSALQYLVEWASQYHPELMKLSNKIEQLRIEQRWNKESLKPTIDLNYSLIDAPINYQGFQEPDWLNNYKLGIDFAFPLLLRKERGSLEKTKLYIEQNNFELLQTEQLVTANIKSVFETLKTNQVLLKEYLTMAEGYQQLLDAELLNLETGESDLFKLNIQQDKYIESRKKYLSAFVKFQNLKAKLPYTIGLPDLSYQNLYK